MSLVERALKKLQQSGSGDFALREPKQPVGPKLPERLAGVEIPTVSSAVSHERPTRIVKIDREALRSLQLLPTPDMEQRIATQYRQIKRSLIAAALGRTEPPLESGQVIMVASALPGEGKTFTSINLALSMAREKDVEVILVNADVAKPHLDSLLGVAGERGLLDLLKDDHLHPDSFILDTDVPRLKFLPAGGHVDTATELLASSRMHELMQQMIRRPGNPIVLLDSPPLLLSTESQAMISSVGQVVLVVRANVTPRQAVEAAVSAAAGAKSISLILNQSTESISDAYYGYGPYGDAQSGPSPPAVE